MPNRIQSPRLAHVTTHLGFVPNVTLFLTRMDYPHFIGFASSTGAWRRGGEPARVKKKKKLEEARHRFLRASEVATVVIRWESESRKVPTNCEGSVIGWLHVPPLGFRMLHFGYTDRWGGVRQGIQSTCRVPLRVCTDDRYTRFNGVRR